MSPERKNCQIGYLSVAIVPFRSILACCALAIYFTKALLKPHLSLSLQANPSVEQIVYVDDSIGTLHDVANNLAVAAGQFAVVARRLRVIVFTNATVIAPHFATVGLLSARLSATKVPHEVKATARDLCISWLSARAGAVASCWPALNSLASASVRLLV